MCTVTWRAAEPGGYDLFFNRDERDVRAPELPPQRRHTAGGAAYLAPEDGDHGGTWLMLNARGLTVGLLNYYPRGIAEAGVESRGALPLACASGERAEDVPRLMRERVLGGFAPFHLVAVDAAGGAVHLRWDGRALHEAPAPRFLTSSSFEAERVQAARATKFAAWSERTVDGLAAFHRGYDEEAGAESVCMRRADACTRSICAVRVRPETRELAYQRVEWGQGAGARTSDPLVLWV